MRKYNQRLYRICKGYLNEEDEIEDTMQDAYVRAYQNLHRFEKQSSFSTWLIRILINECLQKLRKLNRHSRLEYMGENIDTMKIIENQNPETRSLDKELKHILEQ